FRLRDFAAAGNSETGAAISDRPTTIAPRRSCEATRQQEKLLQHFDCPDHGDEGAARNQESTPARDRDDRKSLGRGAVPSKGKPDIERSRSGGWLAGRRHFRVENIARGKSARSEVAPPTGTALSSGRSKRARGRRLQSNQRDQSARCGGITTRQECVRSSNH